MKYINVALPKGRLGEKVYAMFEQSGYECPSIKENNRKLIFENEENTFNFKIGEKSAAITISADIKENLEKAICKASARVSLRIGDMVALELAPPETAINRTDEEVHLKGEFCENSLFDFKMIF